MSEKKFLLVLSIIINYANTSDKINNLIGFIIVKIRSNLMASIAIHPFKS